MIKGFNAVIIPVSDIKRAAEFYEKVLGLKKEFECPTYVNFDCCGVEIGLEAGGKKGKKEGAPYVMIEVDDVDLEYQRLKEKGIKFTDEPKDKSLGGG